VLARDEIPSAVESILRLRNAERRADPETRPQIASARKFLERLVGQTVRPADAARVLGVSRPALKRWIDKGEISSVITRQGRREVPVAELVDLRDEISHLPQPRGRSLARVIRDRRRRADDAIDIDRLLPRKRARSHRVAELHALAYHRVVADRLDQELVEQAQERLREWRQDGRISPMWADRWARVLARPIPKVAETLRADTRSARELRQSSPFAGVLTEQERRRLVRAVEERAAV
jgi:excisionase family DNA binding protein